MAFRLADAYVQFSQRGLSGVQGQVSGISRGFSGAMGVVSRFSGALAGIGAVTTAGGMLKLAADAEQSAVQFRALLGSGDAAKQMLSEIDAFAASTPFEQLQLQKAAQALLNYQTPAGEVLSILRQLGDAAAISGADLGELTTVYGRAVANGKVLTQDLEMMVDRGVQIIPSLMQQVGAATQGEFRKMVSEGRVSGDHLRAAFEAMSAAGGVYERGMAQLADTTAGRFSTMTGNLKREATELGQMFLPLASEVTAGVVGMTENFRASFGSEIDSITDTVGFAVRNAGTLWDIGVEQMSIGTRNMIETIKTLGINVVELASWMVTNWETIFVDWANLNASILTNIGQNLSDFFAAVKQWFAGEGFNFETTNLLEGFEAKTELPTLTQPVTIETTDRLNGLYEELGREDVKFQNEQRQRNQQRAELEKQRDNATQAARSKTEGETTRKSEKAHAASEGRKRQEKDKTAKASIASAEQVFNRMATADSVVEAAEQALPKLGGLEPGKGKPGGTGFGGAKRNAQPNSPPQREAPPPAIPRGSSLPAGIEGAGTGKLQETLSENNKLTEKLNASLDALTVVVRKKKPATYLA